MGDLKKRAVVIGINTYEDADIPPLLGAKNDADEMYARLTKDGEFTIEESHYLTDGEATSDRIRRAVSDVLWKVDETYLTLLYFSGHGFQDAFGNGFLAPSDMIHDQPLVRGVRLQELRDLMLKAKNKQIVLLVLDSCYSGIATAGDKAGSVAIQSLESSLSGVSEEGIPEGSGRMIMASSGANEKSREQHGCQHRLGAGEPHDHGAFTFQLLEGLDGGAASKESDITLEELRRYADKGLTKTTKEQTVEFFGAGMQHAEQIVLAKAFQQRDIASALNEVREQLQSDDPLSLFAAIERLGAIVTEAPRLVEAKELEEAINIRLLAYRAPAMSFCNAHKIELAPQCKTVFPWLERIATELSFETVTKEEAETRGLLLNLLQAANEDLEYKVFARYMSNQELKSVRKVKSPRGSK
jgi:uncharacterized caspase-like protein